MAARHRRTEGYLLADLAVSVFLLSVVTMLVLYAPRDPSHPSDLFADRYLYEQSAAMKEARAKDMDAGDDAGTSIHFNGSGNVDLARTLSFSTPYRSRQIVIELGGGRLIFRDP